MSPEEQAFANILPDWSLIRQGKQTGAWYVCNDDLRMNITLAVLKGHPRATVSCNGKILYRTGNCTSLEETLINIKSYLDTTYQT